MRYNILLYGATGFSGQLIAAEGKAMGMSSALPAGEFRMILAARNQKKLREVADKNGMPFRCFGLDDVGEIVKRLDGIDVIINAAGPFAATAERLAKAALQAGCHCVDINGEVDVYRKLDDLGRDAALRRIAIVSGAGHVAAASDILLDAALQFLLQNQRIAKTNDLGAVRIALSPSIDFTRGSARTVARSLREQVIVIRKGPVEGKLEEQMVVWHEPIGKLERSFDFGRLAGDGDEQPEKGPRIASAANLIDTLIAQYTVLRHSLCAQAIESYMQMNTAGRIAFQLGGMFASLSTFPLIRILTEAQLSFLPEGPTTEELDKARSVVVLEIENAYRTRLIDWRWETPNVYQFTAQLVVAVARNIAPGKIIGWVTPAHALGLTLAALQKPLDGLRNTSLEVRMV
jgi:short subunit dehydrogenase-like uncharacterized protein